MMGLARGKNPIQILGLFAGVVQCFAAGLCAERAFVLAFRGMREGVNPRTCLQFSGGYAEGMVYIFRGHQA